MKRSNLPKAIRLAIASIYCLGIASSNDTKATNAEILSALNEMATPTEMPVVDAELTDAPLVPAPITRKNPARVVVRLEVKR